MLSENIQTNLFRVSGEHIKTTTTSTTKCHKSKDPCFICAYFTSDHVIKTIIPTPLLREVICKSSTFKTGYRKMYIAQDM